MKAKYRVFKAAACAVTLLLGSSQLMAEELHVYNWSDYIAKDTIANFEKQTGIKVVYDVYDSNEVVEAKLLAGQSGYDVIFPTARPFVDRHIKAGLYQPLDKSALTNYDNMDPDLLESLAGIDPGNKYAVPYMWGTTGIGYNVDKVKAILGDDMPVNSWALIFDPKISSKLKSCGISLMDDVNEVFAAASAYLGQSPDDHSSAAIDKVKALLDKARPNIRYFHSSQYITDLANGDTCVSMGYSGDVLQARDRAEEAGNGVHVAYTVPKEGAVVWTDVMVIPADAPNPEAANKFINYMMEPKVIAEVSNYVAYANANKAATPYVDEEIRKDPGIYPPAEAREHFIVLKTPTERELRLMNRTWTRIKTGR